MKNIQLSNGRVVIHTRHPNGSTLATPTPGDYAFTSNELNEYESITSNKKGLPMKSKCSLKSPAVRINGKISQSSFKAIDRAVAVQWLRLCREKKAEFLRIYAGRYSIVPVGSSNGFVLITR